MKKTITKESVVKVPTVTGNVPTNSRPTDGSGEKVELNLLPVRPISRT